jgi:hypothetical protein
MLVAKHSQNGESGFAQELRRDEPAIAEASNTTSKRAAYAERLQRDEPEAPAAGPDEESTSAFAQESLADLYRERRPKIDIDDSLRLLAFPPRKLR